MPLNSQDRYNSYKASGYKRTNDYVRATKSIHPPYYFSQRLHQYLETSIPCLQECIQQPTDLYSSSRQLQIWYRLHTHHKEIVFRLFRRYTRYSHHYQSTLASSHPRIADNHHTVWFPRCSTTYAPDPCYKSTHSYRPWCTSGRQYTC